jgi:hypothetical protein
MGGRPYPIAVGSNLETPQHDRESEQHRYWGKREMESQ